MGAAYLLAGATHVVILIVSGWPLGTDGSMWFGRLVVCAVVVGVLVLAHVIDAARPRRTPVERLFEDAQPIKQRRGVRVIGIALAIVIALASGLVVGLALAYGIAPNYYVTTAAGIAQAVVLVATIAAGLFVVVPSSRALLPGWLGRIAGVLRGPSASIVAARASAVSRTSGRVVVLLGSFGFLVGFAASVDPAPSLSPTYVGYRSFDSTIDAEAFAAQLRAIDGVAGVVTPPSFRGTDENGNQRLTFAVDPVELGGLDDGLAQMLTDHPTALITNLWNGSAHLHESTGESWGFQPSGVLPLQTCCVSFANRAAGVQVSPDITSFLIYSSDPSLNEAVARDAWSIQPADLAPGNGESLDITGNYSESFIATAISIGILALLFGAPMVALAIGVVRARKSDDATLAALGSSPKDLSRALVVEIAAISAFAMAVGLGSGAVARAGWASLQRARTSLTGVITDSYLATALGSVAWMVLGVVLIATVVLMAATAWVVNRVGASRLPAEQLRAAQAGRVA